MLRLTVVGTKRTAFIDVAKSTASATRKAD